MVTKTLIYRTEIDEDGTVRVEYRTRTYDVPNQILPAILKLAQKAGVQTVWFR